MEGKKDNISVYQIFVMYVLVLTIPGVRTFFTSVSMKAGKGAWLAPLFAIIPGIVLVYILNKLYNINSDKKENLNLTNIFDIVYGKYIGFVLSIIYLFWIIFTGSLETRLFAERLISTTYIYTPIKFFILTMLILVAMVARNKISNFSRFAEVIMEFFIGIVLFVFITGMQNVEIKNLWPPIDLKQLLVGSLDSINLLSFMTYSLFLGDRIENKEKYKKYGIIAVIFAVVVSIMGIIVTLGAFGKDLLPTFAQPFFMAVKEISLFGVLERIEAVFITFWVALDFIMIGYIVIIASQICKLKFNLKERKIAVNPIIFIIYILSIIIANNYFSLQTFTREICLNINYIFGLGIPVLTFIIAKVRKLV